MTLAYLHVCAHTCMCVHVHLWKLEDNFGSSLPLCGSWRSDSGHQAWLQFSYPPNHPACPRLALFKWDICIDSCFSSRANSQVRGPMPWDHYPCTVKGKVESTALGEVLSLSDFHYRELLRSKLYSINKEYYWGSSELPFRRVRQRWWFMLAKNEKETKMVWGRWLWTQHNAFILIRVVRWLYGCLSFCGTFWSYLLTCFFCFSDLNLYCLKSRRSHFLTTVKHGGA